MSNWDERIIVAPRAKLFDGNTPEEFAFQGLLTDELTIVKFLANLAVSTTEMRRGNSNDPTPKENNAEINFDFKQPIPYVVIRKGEKIFLYKRLAKGGEARLFDKFSIGVGGHMNPEPDVDFFTTLLINLERELEEELEIQTDAIEVKIAGMINDDSDEVGKVHLGILVIADLDEEATVAVREADQLEGDWITVEELKQLETFEKLENWSKIALEALK